MSAASRPAGAKRGVHSHPRARRPTPALSPTSPNRDCSTSAAGAPRRQKSLRAGRRGGSRTSPAGRVFNKLAQKLGVKVIHCSEARHARFPTSPNGWMNLSTHGSIEGFREEGTTTAEMGWGTHEGLFPSTPIPTRKGPQNQICVARMGINTWVRSWYPITISRAWLSAHGEHSPSTDTSLSGNMATPSTAPPCTTLTALATTPSSP